MEIAGAPVGARRRGLVLTLSGFLLFATTLIAGSATALPASFDPTFGFVETNLDTIAGPLTMNGESVFAQAGRAGSLPGGLDPAVVIGSPTDDICILAASDNVCRPALSGVDNGGQAYDITGPFSVIVSAEIMAADPATFGGEPFSIFVSGIAPPSSTTEAWGIDEVQVELQPTVPPGLDTSEVPNFPFPGSFPALTHIRDTTLEEQFGVIYNYVAFANVNVGDVITLRYEVTTGRGDRLFRPELMLNATNVVPEPGTALLMGLGLAGLAAGGRRIGARER